ncbi:MAG: hypothetical protein AABX72_01135 [Nanoarchaeota archaeon]
MAVDRKFYFGKHILALVITSLIFIIGLFIGLKISDSRLGLLQDFNEQQKADFESLQLQYAYLTTSNSSCLAFKQALEQSVSNLENARVKLENYIQTSSNSESFLTQKRTYMLAEIRYWLLAREAEKACGKDTVNILFFYQDDETCDTCSTQGYVLTSLKDTFHNNLLIFSLDATSDEPMVTIIKNVYNITSTPSVVVDEEVLKDFILEDDLYSTICSRFSQRHPACVAQ